MDHEKIPYVFLSNHEISELPSVYYNQEEAAFVATQYLIEAGHRNIGCIFSQTSKDEHSMIEQGYARALFKNQILL